MRTIKKPPHFSNAGTYYTIEDFLTSMVSRSHLAKNYSGLQVMARIEADPLHLSESDWLFVCELVQNPPNGYPISQPYRLVPFIDAILSARDVQADAAEAQALAEALAQEAAEAEALAQEALAQEAPEAPETPDLDLTDVFGELEITDDIAPDTLPPNV